MSDKWDIAITPQVVSKVRSKWPTAVRTSIRAEGKCPNCKQAGQVSFQLPSDWDLPIKNGKEFCGFWCCRCGWGNAGSREIEVKSS